MTHLSIGFPHVSTVAWVCSLVSTTITWACRSVEALQLQYVLEALQLLDYNMFCVEEETHGIILNLLISTALQFHWLVQVMVLAR